MEEFYWVLEAKCNAQYPKNMKSVADKYPTSVMELDLEDEAFKADFN